MKRKRSSGRSVWLVPLITLAVLTWFWWRTGNSNPPAKVATLPNSISNSAGPGASGTARQRFPPASTAALPAAPAFTNLPRADAIPLGDHNIRPTAEGYPRPVQNVFELQVALARQGISSGSIDGLLGPQTRAAIRGFQQKEHLPASGELDNATKACAVLTESPTTKYEVTSNDLARLQPLGSTWLEKSRQTALEYENVLELVAEQAQAHPGLVKQLNPAVVWTNLPAGTIVEVPNAVFSPGPRAAFITIRLADKFLEAWDGSTNLLAHFPCSIARRVEKRPVGELHVAVIVHHPNYTFAPENFPESAEAQQLKTKLVLPPGPNNPVGVAWIGLDRPGYGIHGTTNPEQVGRTESHGCFRLANWNAECLARMVELGTPVYIEP